MQIQRFSIYSNTKSAILAVPWLCNIQSSVCVYSVSPSFMDNDRSTESSIYVIIHGKRVFSECQKINIFHIRKFNKLNRFKNHTHNNKYKFHLFHPITHRHGTSIVGTAIETSLGSNGHPHHGPYVILGSKNHQNPDWRWRCTNRTSHLRPQNWQTWNRRLRLEQFANIRWP